MVYRTAGFTIQPIDLGDGDVLKTLAVEASAEGFQFVDRLISEWKSGAIRFSKPGEKLLGVFDREMLIAVGGLNRDPYAWHDHVGRLRHTYVYRRYRRLGVGKKLVTALLEDLDEHFERVRLRTTTTAASRFYEACEFRSSEDADASHERV
ncbi:MAG: GNAT family N-acetyltransferase [Geminicoccaceae bacterium]